MVEFSIVAFFFFVFVLGGIDFFLGFHQWNLALKAAERGARIAAVSAPVDSGLRLVTGLTGNANPGDPMPANSFDIVCNGATQTCSGTGSKGYVKGTNNPMDQIVLGRGSTACGDARSAYDHGMCDVFLGIQPKNVIIEYRQTGLGFAGRPGGPVPTIHLSLVDVPFRFFFLSGLLGFNRVSLPPIRVTITGEDLWSGAPEPGV